MPNYDTSEILEKFFNIPLVFHILDIYDWYFWKKMVAENSPRIFNYDIFCRKFIVFYGFNFHLVFMRFSCKITKILPVIVFEISLKIYFNDIFEKYDININIL